MLKITEAEHQKLVSLAYDEVGMEALKKFFLETFLVGNSVPSDTPLLAAERLSILQLGQCFDRLARLAEKAQENTVRKNVV